METLRTPILTFNPSGILSPPSTNPAEHFLDLVNADFSSSKEVDNLLDTWEERKPQINRSMHGAQNVDSDVTEGINKVEGHRRSLSREIIIMFRRSITLIIRDPILYLGRCLVFLISNCFFAFVYWNARSYTQDQAFNKVWISIWIIAVPSNMGVVAVYALNDEFKSILRETKNGMVSPISYILAKTILVIPIMFVFAIFGLGIPAFVIQDFAGAAFGRCIVLWAALIYVFECAAECFAVLFDDPILGMMQFMNIWFGAFLFGGFLIPLRDMYWPFEVSCSRACVDFFVSSGNFTYQLLSCYRSSFTTSSPTRTTFGLSYTLSSLLPNGRRVLCQPKRLFVSIRQTGRMCFLD